MNHQRTSLVGSARSRHFRVLLLLASFLAAASQGENSIQLESEVKALRNAVKPKERIVGGKTAQRGAYPFFAQWMKGCGGTLIHDDIVLTAGHCLASSKDLKYDIFVGGHESGTGYQRRIIDHVRHPRYSFKEDKAYDFLLLKLDQPIPNPQLITLNQDPNYPYSDEMFTVIGFGFLAEDRAATAQYLQEVQVPHIQDCSPYYREDSVKNHIAFCAGHKEGGKDSCQADSGGALLNPKTNVQVGLVSWGRGCARPNSPGVYARVSTVYSWLQHQICEMSEVPPEHCVELRVDVTMDDFPFETEWALLDSYGHEMVLSKRGAVRKSGLTSSVLRIPAGSYRFYMSDQDGICCSHGQGGIALYDDSTTSNKLLEHDGRFQNDLVLPFKIGNVQDESYTGFASNQVTTNPPQTTSAPAGSGTTTNDLGIHDEDGHMVTAPGSALDFNTGYVPSSTLAPIENFINDESQEEIIVGSTLRVEIFYDMHPTETGWFLVNTDSYEEIYASKYDNNRLIPQNADNALSLVVEEFDELEPGPYWFLVADTGSNGICCGRGRGSIRIVQLKWTTTVQALRDQTTNTKVEEHVIWEHNGEFGAYAELHFRL